MVGLPESEGYIMGVLGWIQSFWKSGDFAVVPQSQNATVIGRITQLTEQKHSTKYKVYVRPIETLSSFDANNQDSPHPVRPIAEHIKELKQKADRKRSKRLQVASKPKRRPKAKL